MSKPLQQSGWPGRWRGWPLAALCALQTALGTAAPAVVQDAATHEQLALQLRKTLQDDPMRRLPASQGDDPARNRPRNLLSQSDILCFGGVATLLPKRAILLLPKTLASRSEFTEGAALMGWAEFFARNRGWITTVEVPRLQAEGSEPLTTEVTRSLAEATRVVVATCQGGPISVLPLKVPPATSASPATTDNPQP